jgi:hypothetical protein
MGCACISVLMTHALPCDRCWQGMPRSRSSGQAAQRQDKRDTEQSQERQLRVIRDYGVGSWYYRRRIGRMRSGV